MPARSARPQRTRTVAAAPGANCRPGPRSSPCRHHPCRAAAFSSNGPLRRAVPSWRQMRSRSQASIAEVSRQKVNIVNTRGMATITVQELMKRRRHLEELGIEPSILYVIDASRLMGSLLSGESDICMFSGIGSVLTAIEKERGSRSWPAR